MGLPLRLAAMVANTCLRNNIRGRCLTLGRQDVNMTVDELVAMLVHCGYMERDAATGVITTTRAEAAEAMRRVRAAGQDVAATKHLREQCWISDKLLFAGLGFSDMKSLDVSDFDGADILYDLNQPGLGAHLDAPYDLVIDGGTLEHVFDVRTVMRNLFEAAATGGYIMHAAPMNNYCDHGFFQFSPTFFLDYYAANDFRIDSIKLVRHTADPLSGPWQIRDYPPESVPDLPGNLDDGRYLVVACVQKTGRSTWERIPSQGAYRRAWAGK